MQSPGKLLILTGVFLIMFGLLFTFWHQLPLLGRLPGDIFVNRGRLQFYFPLVTCLILSGVLTFIANIIIRLLR
ncbi:MAG: DUF2905 domain-containing protein [Dehalococcoidia bacterium]|nr:DUF2905 domain-containing protein [Dehalococcoidia bacterium]